MIGTLGVVLVASPGTPVQLTDNQDNPDLRVPAQSVRIQPLPTNAGIIYVGLKGLDVSTTEFGTQLLGVIPKPANATTGPFEPFEATVYDVANGMNLADFWIDGTNAQDGVIVTYTNQ